MRSKGKPPHDYTGKEVTHLCYQLTYVPLDLDIYSHAYHDSIKSKTFKTQHKLLTALHELLRKEDE